MYDQNNIDKMQELCTEMRNEMLSMGYLGPWIEEPDRVEFKAEGFDCLMVRVSHSFSWCGYVGVPTSHPLYGKAYDEVDIHVHGGLTYSEKCRGPVCHKEDAEPLWWFGFGCAHFMDLSPGIKIALKRLVSDFGSDRDDIYRDVNYVKEQVKQLTKQLKILGEENDKEK